MLQELINLGLTKNEAKVYSSLLEIGRTNAGELIKKTKLHRNIVYDNLEKLIEKGLVSFILIKNIKQFEITSSNELKEFVEKKKKEIQEEEEILKKILPQIQERKFSLKKAKATIFSGKRGLKNILEEITQVKSELLVLGTGWGMKETLGEYYNQWHLKLKLNKTKCRIILPENKKENFLSPFSRKYLPEKEIIPSTIAVYEDKTLNIIWSEEPTAILITNKENADSYKNYFEKLWKISKK